jgi:hypothetical protein
MIKPVTDGLDDHVMLLRLFLVEPIGIEPMTS